MKMKINRVTTLWPVFITVTVLPYEGYFATGLCNFHITRWHAHTVVWECCKDDRQSQFDPQPTLNRWTDRHKIWNTWLRRGYLLPKNLGSIRPGDFAPHIPEIYTQNLRMFTSLFQFFRAPTDEPVRPIFTFNTSYDVVLRKVVPFGVRKINIKI